MQTCLHIVVEFYDLYEMDLLQNSWVVGEVLNGARELSLHTFIAISSVSKLQGESIMVL